MSVEEYDTTYPNIQKVCKNRVVAIKSGIHKIDDATGLTMHQTSVVKSMATSFATGDDGLNRYQRSAKLTRLTHLATIDEDGRNGYQRQAHLRKTTVQDNGLTVEQNAHIKQKAACIASNKSGNKGASKICIKILSPLLTLLTENNIKHYFGENEYGVMDPTTVKYYFFDLVIPELKIAVEYQSNAWHADPSLGEEHWVNWKPVRGPIKTSVEVLGYDYDKARALYRERGYITHYVWENTRQQDVENIICLVQTMIMKY